MPNQNTKSRRDYPQVRTKRWTRSPRGEILGVATGLAEWRGFPVDITRLLVLIACLFTGMFPGIVIYIALGIFLPEQKPSDIIGSSYAYSYSSPSDSSTKTNEDLRKEYEEMKKKVEEMESEMFDREKDWDERFKKE